MSVSKEHYYKIRAKDYPLHDPEALIRYQRIQRWLDFDSSPSIGEIGCKFAILREILKKRSPKATYIGVDIDRDTLKKIPDFDEKEFKCHNVNNGFPFESDSLDYIVCLEIMEHLENATFFFEEVKRSLKKDGKLILSLPNPYCWMELYRNFRRKPDTEGHIASYTYQNINALLGFADLKLYDMQGSFTRIPLPRKIFGSYKIVQTNLMWLTRNYLFLIGR